MTPFILGQFGQCARYSHFITCFLPGCLSESGDTTEGPRGGKEGTGGEREERKGEIDGCIWWERRRKSIRQGRNNGKREGKGRNEQNEGDRKGLQYVGKRGT